MLSCIFFASFFPPSFSAPPPSPHYNHTAIYFWFLLLLFIIRIIFLLIFPFDFPGLLLPRTQWTNSSTVFPFFNTLMLSSFVTVLSFFTVIPGRLRLQIFIFRVETRTPNLIILLPSTVSLTGFDMGGVTLGGPCFVAAATSLGSLRLEAVPIEVFTLLSDPSKRIVLWAVRPLHTMDVGTFERLWNYPTAAILQREVDVARDRQLLEPDSSRRLRDLQKAEQALRDHRPPPSIETLRKMLQRAIERVQTDSNPERTKEVDEASRALESAQPVKLQFRSFDDPDMHLLGIALRSFSNSPAASDADRLLVYLLHYSFSKNDTAKKYSVASSLSPASRSVIFCAIVSLLNDTDEIVEFELDDLDELRLRSLREDHHILRHCSLPNTAFSCCI